MKLGFHNSEKLLSLHGKRKFFHVLSSIIDSGLNLHKGLQNREKQLASIHPKLSHLKSYLEEGKGIEAAFWKTGWIYFFSF